MQRKKKFKQSLIKITSFRYLKIVRKKLIIYCSLHIYQDEYEYEYHVEHTSLLVLLKSKSPDKKILSRIISAIKFIFY